MRGGTAAIRSGGTGDGKLYSVRAGRRTPSASAATSAAATRVAATAATDQRENHRKGDNQKHDSQSTPVPFLPVSGQHHAEHPYSGETRPEIRIAAMLVHIRRRHQ